MNTKVLTLMIISVLGFTMSCSKTDINNAQQEQQEAPDVITVDTVDGLWNLKSIRGGIQGVESNYDLGQVVWDFDNTTLTIHDNTTDNSQNPYTGLGNGTYDFEIIESGGVQVLSINSITIGEVIVSDNQLMIDNSAAADGFTTEFERSSANE